MMLRTTNEELRQILREDYGREVTQAEASEIAYTLIGCFDLLAEVYHRIQTGERNHG